MDRAARQTFLQQYASIRHAEGRGSRDPAWYQALPFQASEQWRIRARSYVHFEGRVLREIEKEASRPLSILDLGAGNGWMSNRLSVRGHRPVAVDIFADRLDGLGAARNYQATISTVLAEFDQLPFAPESFDFAIFNSSLHYSSDYRRTLSELRQCLRKPGRFFVIDSPVYACAEHGKRMREERQAHFERTYGFRSEAARSIEYLDEETLATLAEEVGIKWVRTVPWYGWKWALRPLRARITGARPPSRFMILEGRFQT